MVDNTAITYLQMLAIAVVDNCNTQDDFRAAYAIYTGRLNDALCDAWDKRRLQLKASSQRINLTVV
jgi:hypothetical protein